MKPVDRIIEKFGGISALATALGHKHASTVSQWKVRGVIPARQQEAVLAAAKRENVPLEPSDFFQDADDQEPDSASNGQAA